MAVLLNDNESGYSDRLVDLAIYMKSSGGFDSQREPRGRESREGRRLQGDVVVNNSGSGLKTLAAGSCGREGGDKAAVEL